MPVTVRGRGTTLTGAAVPLRGGWVIDLTGLRRVRIDAEAGLAYVQAGAPNAAVHAAAEARGWFYPPDPSSNEYCTIGGNIACNAGGMHGGKYGVTRDYVLALKGFLPTGEWVEWGTATKKFSAGFNLRDLWIGSEGLLGVVTDAVLKLIPRPAARWTLLTAFSRRGRGAARRPRAVRPAGAAGDLRISRPLQRAVRGTGDPPARVSRPGRPAGHPARTRRLGPGDRATRNRTCSPGPGGTPRPSAPRAAAPRRSSYGPCAASARARCSSWVTPSSTRTWPCPCGSTSASPASSTACAAESGLPIPTFGHLADGNLHVNIMYHQADPAECRAAEAAVQTLMETVVALGGAISGEHGIGLAKTPFLRLQHRPAQVRAMLAVKKALDPRGILNPGKMFEVFRIWRHPRIKVRLPWDHK